MKNNFFIETQLMELNSPLTANYYKKFHEEALRKEEAYMAAAYEDIQRERHHEMEIKTKSVEDHKRVNNDEELKRMKRQKHIKEIESSNCGVELYDENGHKYFVPIKMFEQIFETNRYEKR
jgi:septin family protein